MGESSQEDLFATIEAERDLALQAIAARSPETNDLLRGYVLFKMDLAEAGHETWVAQSGLTRDQVGVYRSTSS